ncbi:hypothetical protein BDM02DRAFT_3120333, partial [Thelephora ganbajun]
MDYANGKQLFHKDPYMTADKILNKVSEALKTILYVSNLVFGDLKHHVQLMDFDWCGKAEEEEHPASINLVGIEWSDATVMGGLLQFERDNEMLWKLS